MTDGELAAAKLRYLPSNARIRTVKEIPAGKILVHNHVRPAQRQGVRGFHFWYDDEGTERREICDCSWADHLPQHYRVVHHDA